MLDLLTLFCVCLQLLIGSTSGSSIKEDAQTPLLPESKLSADTADQKRGNEYFSWGGKRAPEYFAWGGKRAPEYFAWGGKREQPEYFSWGGKKRSSPEYFAWGGKRDKEYFAWGGKRAPEYFAWGGKRAPEYFAWGGKRTPEYFSWGGKRAPEYFAWGGKRSKDTVEVDRPGQSNGVGPTEDLQQAPPPPLVMAHDTIDTLKFGADGTDFPSGHQQRQKSIIDEAATAD